MKIMFRWNHMKIKGDISVKSLLWKIRSGFEMLSQIKWVSRHGAHLSMASIVAAIGLHFVLRDGTLGNLSNLLVFDRDTSSEKLWFVPGLRNLGNNCFLNAVLQSLASCSSFRRFLDELKEFQLLSNEGQVEDLPLMMSLATLVEELGALKDRSSSLNPKKVMSAMQDYIPQFQLANQQDSAEALLHLLSCLRDELSDSLTPNCGSLADLDTPTSRIFDIETIHNVNEIRRWREQYLGPFDGVLSSFLTCHTCSSEILMDSGFFHTLPLSLMSNTKTSVLGKFKLEDSIKRFLSPELVENYSCSHCWHIAASKYLTSIEGKQEEICKLRGCAAQEFCDCKNLPSLQSLPWSNRFSHTIKQLHIACFPQILCLHLQRTSLNLLGELVKIQGRISFPLILDLSPFAKYEFDIHKRKVNETKIRGEQLFPSSTYNPRIFDICLNPIATVKVKDEAPQISPQECSLQNATCSNNISVPTATDKVFNDTMPSKAQLYRLVAAVEHFGKAGSGHYTVYRGVRAQIEEGHVDGGINKLPMQWFHISDSNVHHASEEDVLGAEASLLFYERI
ncbi:ubiquitin carboxyl-terminal hydrolase 27-like isoform X1 [Silene latifolia]|uniref:ubiquitin carboxyl-terminal hydrolase 27-like isoform X1 n=1 Tax=Silene latifolia TaxID=37657 RepID=UPI003D78307C